MSSQLIYLCVQQFHTQNQNGQSDIVLSLCFHWRPEFGYQISEAIKSKEMWRMKQQQNSVADEHFAGSLNVGTNKSWPENIVWRFDRSFTHSLRSFCRWCYFCLLCCCRLRRSFVRSFVQGVHACFLFCLWHLILVLSIYCFILCKLSITAYHCQSTEYQLIPIVDFVTTHIFLTK